MYFGRISKAKNIKNKTSLTINLDTDILGKISRLNTGTGVSAEVRLNDGRNITVEQRKKIYATLGDISKYLGYPPEELKMIMKYYFIAETGEEYFSLSNCSVTLARDFIDYLISFSIQWDIPLSEPGYLRAEDIDKYLYMCLKTRTCCISGKKHADIHHCLGSRVGAGYNRNKIDNRGRKLIALSREYHNMVHDKGEEEVFKTYGVYGIELDEKTLRELGLSVKNIF